MRYLVLMRFSIRPVLQNLPGNRSFVRCVGYRYSIEPDVDALGDAKPEVFERECHLDAARHLHVWAVRGRPLSLKLAASQSLDLVCVALRNFVAPLADKSLPDAQTPGEFRPGTEIFDGAGFLHNGGLSLLGNPVSTKRDRVCAKRIQMETGHRPKTRAQRIRFLREAKGWTLETLGKKVGAGKAAVSKWENDSDINIELDKFFKLADVLGIDPRELLTGEPAPGRPSLLPRRLALIEAYGRLPQEIRTPLRSMIEVLDVAATEHYAAWSRERQVEADNRDRKRKEKA